MELLLQHIPLVAKDILQIEDAAIRLAPRGPDLRERIMKPKLEALWELSRSVATNRNQVDLVHNPYWTAPLWKTRPLVVTVHDVVPILPQPGFDVYQGGLRSKAYYRLISYGTRRANRIIADSAAAASDIVELLNVSSSRVEVVYLAPDARFFEVPDPDVAGEVPRRL